MAESCVRSVKKALDALDRVLEARLDGRGLTLSGIAADLGEKPTTVRNILKTMEQCGYLARDGKFYVPGPKCADLRRSATAAALIDAATPTMRHAAVETGESFVLTALHNSRRVVLARFEGGGQVVVRAEAGMEKGPYNLVTARAMLAGADPATTARYAEVNGPPGDDWPEAKAKGLAAALAALRQRGYAAADVGEVVGYALPLRDIDGELLGAAGCSVPRFRHDAAGEARVLEALRAVAADLAKKKL